ncbi:MAG: LamG domain-containing protein [Gammaproteobacteria bacterium]|nr:LamG domain-containing protein [Gammaproteobacteria bacterium]
MSRNFQSGDGSRTASISHNIGTGDYTAAAWVVPESVSNSYHIVFGNNGYVPGFNTKVGSSGNWGSYFGGNRASGNTLSIDTLYHLAWQRESGTLKFFQDGIQTGTTHSVSTSMANDVASFGSNDGGSHFLIGQESHLSLWDVALSDNEMTALSRGVCPKRIRPANQWYYIPMWGDDDPEPDLSGRGNTVSIITGTPAKENNVNVELLENFI